jgi:hypothetical protein
MGWAEPAYILCDPPDALFGSIIRLPEVYVE